MWDTVLAGSEAGDEISWAFTDYDAGTLYDTYADLVAGPGGSTYDVTADGLSATGQPYDWDSWGILKLDKVRNVTTATNLWFAGDGGVQVYGLYWGEKDSSLTVTNQANPNFVNFSIIGGGMQMAGWETAAAGAQSATYWDTLAQTLGTGGLLADPTTPGYTGISDLGGELIIAASSKPIDWSLEPTGSLPGGTYDFGSGYTLNVSTSVFNGSSWFCASDPDPLKNGYGLGTINPDLSNLGWTPSSVKFYFAQDYNKSISGPAGAQWTANSTDPAKMVMTPELSSSALMLLGFIPMGLGWWRRRKA